MECLDLHFQYGNHPPLYVAAEHLKCAGATEKLKLKF